MKIKSFIVVLVFLSSALPSAFARPLRFFGPRVVVPVPHRPVVVAPARGYVAGPAEVQRALARRGYYHGAIDGLIGSGSRGAIRAFQADQGLAPTGEINGPLLRALGL